MSLPSSFKYLSEWSQRVKLSLSKTSSSWTLVISNTISSFELLIAEVKCCNLNEQDNEGFQDLEQKSYET